MTPETVKVRIAVVVNRHGEYYATGSDIIETDERLISRVTEGLVWRGASVSIVTATLPIPTAREVEGVVEQ